MNTKHYLEFLNIDFGTKMVSITLANVDVEDVMKSFKRFLKIAF
jgi:hypothetical protein